MPAVESLWHAALTARLSRGDAFVALGGGLVGDVVGFAAATYLRGIAVVQAPTTLLAMVDASTGGKTGINLALPTSGLGKNLAGAFWPPRVVIADPVTLKTLPQRELRSGLAECIKHAIIDSELHVAFLESMLDRVLAGDDDAIVEVVARSVAVKAAIVSRDPREEGERAILNLGHTFGHALETHPALELTHGEAVAIGLVAAIELGQGQAPRTGAAANGLAQRVRLLLVRAGLPVSVPSAVDAGEIVRRMGFDKKSADGAVRFVVPEAIGRVQIGVTATESAVLAALAAVGVG